MRDWVAASQRSPFGLDSGGRGSSSTEAPRVPTIAKKAKCGVRSRRCGSVEVQARLTDPRRVASRNARSPADPEIRQVALPMAFQSQMAQMAKCRRWQQGVVIRSTWSVQRPSVRADGTSVKFRPTELRHLGFCMECFFFDAIRAVSAAGWGISFSDPAIWPRSTSLLHIPADNKRKSSPPGSSPLAARVDS